ncbi:MAG: rRNA maturation RNase YbeY [Caldiserica bacterium]|nr:MAG: rRNA maturation RNase YbeY [Caldisericota bacterium]
MKKVEILEREGKIPVKKAKLRGLTKNIMKEEGISDYLISLVYAEKELLRKLNKKYRNLDRSTNVLSFLYEAQPLLFGEIIISKYHVEVKKESFLKLYIHGLLHLLGYDHMKEKEREMMRKKEDYYLEKVKNES